MKRYILPLAAAFALLLSGCNKFLDVQPRGTLTNDEMFSNIQGYRDAMYGIYGTMASTDLYGGNLSYGFADKIGQMLLNPDTEKTDLEAADYAYTNLNVRPVIDEIWASEYEVISYVNNVLANAETGGVTHEDINLIRGEAYGLRAFLHFDVLRLFAADYIQTSGASGIPYAYTYDLKNKQLFNLKDAYANVLSDLDLAEKYLTQDPMEMSEINLATGNAAYRMTRYVHFNKFAVDALRARVYRAMGDYQNAAKYASKVINENGGLFSLTRASNFKNVRRFPAEGELIFGLFTRGLNESVHTLFLSNPVGSGSVAEGRRDIDALYETSTFSATNTDSRYDAYYKKETTGIAFTRFLASTTEMTNNPLAGITLIRLPEMYLILAEAQFAADRGKAIETLNVLRASRGLEGRSAGSYADQADFNAELLKEYMREFPGEGQVFFAFKHFNIPLKSFITGDDDIEPSSAKFVLPWPEIENQFGSVGKN